MDQDERRVRKNQLRREQRAKMRQDSLSMEYIRLKYNSIYTEAIGYYNTLNKKYPEKFDLRKTEEVKALKPTIEKPTEQVPRPQAPDFPNPPTPIRLRFGERFIYKDTFQLKIPLMCPFTPEKTVTTETVTPEKTVTTETVTPEKTVTTETVTTEVIQEGTVYVPPEILPTLVDDEIPEDTIYPSLFDELDPRLVQQIIDELQGDPDFKNIMTNIEQEINYEDMDIDMDVLDDYTLEKEL